MRHQRKPERKEIRIAIQADGGKWGAYLKTQFKALFMVQSDCWWKMAEDGRADCSGSIYGYAITFHPSTDWDFHG
jgi:hypothetical protein